jgi:phytanoyl-CoA hydroxylase
MSPVAFDETLMALSEHPDLTALVTKLVSDTPSLFQSMALVKPPKHGSEKPWHQDLAYFNYSPDMPVVGCWIAIDQATPENGCMHILPGSHKQGPRLHFRRRDWQICDTDMDVTDDTVVPLQPGGMLVFSGLMQHGTPDNHSEHRRRALQYHYRPASAEGITEEERLKVYGGEGKGVSC